jgi:hypothetical protein
MSTRAFVAVSLLAAASMAFAGSSGSPTGKSNKVQQGAAVVGKEKATGIYDNVGNGESTGLPQFAFTPVADTTISCGRASCSVLIEAMGQIQSAGADWAICLLVDGVDYECQYQGVQAGPSSFVVGNARAYAPALSAGSHTVEMQEYTESASATYQYFQMDVTTLKP